MKQLLVSTAENTVKQLLVSTAENTVKQLLVSAFLLSTEFTSVEETILHYDGNTTPVLSPHRIDFGGRDDWALRRET